VEKRHDLIGPLERLALPPCLPFRGALLQQPARRCPFSYSTEHRHNQPPGAAKLSSAEAVLTSSATAIVTRKQSLPVCVCVCTCAYMCVGLCDCVHAFIYIITWNHGLRACTCRKTEGSHPCMDMVNTHYFTSLRL